MRIPRFGDGALTPRAGPDLRAMSTTWGPLRAQSHRQISSANRGFLSCRRRQSSPAPLKPFPARLVTRRAHVRVKKGFQCPRGVKKPTAASSCAAILSEYWFDPGICRDIEQESGEIVIPIQGQTAPLTCLSRQINVTNHTNMRDLSSLLMKGRQQLVRFATDRRLERQVVGQLRGYSTLEARPEASFDSAHKLASLRFFAILNNALATGSTSTRSCSANHFPMMKASLE